MTKKNSVFMNLVKGAFGLPTSDCCALPVAPTEQATCCGGSTTEATKTNPEQA